ncbi:inositol monophosphatase family protein [Pontibacillus litoralis]|uniref:inositol-phosphate phosphatase n=1 Tax=Pontibacillus litoralis JSM 072002 TaxID=1385512 RepID=A0A0A5G9P8_9BACI|nr:inositol monophosphatase family protein [Pontibacillus litoralis]KGX88774.1 inositol monophosphatase [Pontibacillus litoralis JSM 072002]
MNNKDKQMIYYKAKEFVLEAGERIRQKMHCPFVIETKSNPNDLVTEIDQDTERFFAERIRSEFPTHRLLGEEGLGDHVKDLQGTLWIVDPIDGTMNFVHQKRNFAISVAVYQDGVGEIGLIYDVMTDCLYHAKRGEGAYKNGDLLRPLSKEKSLAEAIVGVNGIWATENTRVHKEGIQQLIRKVRGTRSYGSAALEFAYVAEGIMDAYVTMRLSPWDIAAGMVLVQEVGGMTTQANGKAVNMLMTNSIVATNKAIHQEIMEQYITLKKY